jgi:hypothetical protein
MLVSLKITRVSVTPKASKICSIDYKVSFKVDTYLDESIAFKKSPDKADVNTETTM